jgi:hypothetical protein
VAAGLPLMLVALAAMAAADDAAEAAGVRRGGDLSGHAAKFSTGRVTGQDIGLGMRQLRSKSWRSVSTKNVLSAGFATGSPRRLLPLAGAEPCR